MQKIDNKTTMQNTGTPGQSDIRTTVMHTLRQVGIDTYTDNTAKPRLQKLNKR